MRRADPPPDGDAPPLASSYPDSDVGSSPRSVGAAPPSRPAFPPDDSLKWDDASFNRVKLMCSCGGRIIPRPHDNQLRYVGGDSRIAVVSRNISFADLTSKLSRMFGSSVIIKYQLPYEDLDALISVTSDEDLENMMEEYDRLQSVAYQNVGSRSSASARLRLFLFPSKLERSQTASLSEMMENNHSRERWFVDILNGLPVPSRVRSETSSIVSETPDYHFHSTVDALEEWAAAASYGNSVPSSTGNAVSLASQFGSLLQQPSPSEAASAPGSPSPFKAKPTATASSSSAPPEVLSVLSSIADAASTGQPVKPMEADQALDDLSTKSHLGSVDSSGSIPEQRKHVDSETLLSSDKNILSGSVGAAEQLLPAGLMDDDDMSQKYLATKGSFDKVSESSEPAGFDAGLHQMVLDPAKYKVDLVSETGAVTGQPIFDDELLPAHMIARKMNALQIDEGVLSPKIISPSKISTAATPLMPSGLNPEQVMPKFGSDEKLKHHAFPLSPRAGAHLNTEDKVVQPSVPASALNISPASRGNGDDGSSMQKLPSLAQFLPSLIATQQPSAIVNEEDMVVSQTLGANQTRDADPTHKFQGTAGIITSMISPSFVPATVQQEKLPPAPGPSYFYQQLPTQGLEAQFSAVMQATQAPSTQLPSLQASSTVMGLVSKPFPPATVPVRPANVAPASRPAAAMPRPQSPPVAAPQHASSLIPPVRTTGPSSPMGQSKLVTNASQLDTLKGNVPVSTSVNPSIPTAVISSRGEGMIAWGSPYQQGDMMNIQRQVGDGIHGQRLPGVAPQPGSQFNAVNISATPAPGMPSRFRAVGHPLQQVAEGIPMQQSALGGMIPDKKTPAGMMRVGPSSSPRPVPAIPSGQFGYATAAQQSSAALGGSPRYNTPANLTLGVPVSSSEIPPFTGANPFVDDFQGASAYQDTIEAPTADQRHPMRQK